MVWIGLGKDLKDIPPDFKVLYNYLSLLGSTDPED
jgi:hypothetical protein